MSSRRLSALLCFLILLPGASAGSVRVVPRPYAVHVPRLIRLSLADPHSGDIRLDSSLGGTLALPSLGFLDIPPQLADEVEDAKVSAFLALSEAAGPAEPKDASLVPEESNFRASDILSATRALLAHPWPGNVRELEHAVERAVLMASGRTIGAGDLGLRSGSSRHGRVPRNQDRSLPA